jgi:hypothetical protein
MPIFAATSSASVRQADRRIDVDLVDLLRRVRGDFLDVHAALGARHQRHALRRAIHHHADVELLLDVGALLDQQPAHLLPGGAGLVRHELHAEDLGGALAHFVERAREFHAAALAATARMDLRLDHPHRPAERLRGLHGVVDAERGNAARHRHAVAPEQLLALVLVDLHRVIPSLIGVGGGWSFAAARFLGAYQRG